MENSILVTTSLGHQMTVFRNDHVDDKIARNGLYEKENLLLLLKLLEQLPQATVLVIGANIGNHTLAFATRAHAVHAFEPIPYLYDLLSCIVTRNGVAHVRTHNIALSDLEGTAKINTENQRNL